MAGSKQGKKRGTLELPVTTWQVFGLMLLAGVGLTVLIALGTILLLTSSPARTSIRSWRCSELS